MLRVTLVVPMLSNQGGGLAEAVRMQAQALAGQDGVVVDILTTRDGPRDLNDLLVKHVTVRVFRFHGPNGFRFAPALLRHLLRSRPDVVHLHGLWNFQGLAVLVWALVHRGRYAVSAHGMLEPWIMARSRLAKAIVSWLWQDRLLRRAVACCALTATEADQLRDRGATTIAVIPNFVPAFRRPNTTPAWWRDEFKGRTIFLFLCRIHDKKGWRELCEAWAQFCADPAVAQRTALVLCGWVDGAPDFAATVEQLAARCGNVVYAGPQFGVAKDATLAHASFFVLPSKSEGLPIGVLEAWAAGVPALISAECRLPEGFARKAAIECSTHPSTILAALRLAMVLQRPERQAMAHAARQLAATAFSEGQVIGDLLAVYRRVAEVEA